jgi:WD40 repeat protein
MQSFPKQEIFMDTPNDLTIRIPNALKQKIAFEAERQGLTSNELAMYILATEFGSPVLNKQLFPHDLSPKHFHSEAQKQHETDLNCFKNEVQKLYHIAGYNITENENSSNSLFIDHKYCGIINRYMVECRDSEINLDDCGHLIKIKNIDQNQGLIIIASKGFDPEALTILESHNISCLSFCDLVYELFPLKDYFHKQISIYKNKAIEKWDGKDGFIHPTIYDQSIQSYPGVAYLSRWLQNNQSILLILGNVGSGKTTFLEFLCYQMAQGFLNDPTICPLPVLIPLVEAEHAKSFDDIILNHFSNHGFKDINLERFYQLFHMRRIVLLLDSLDSISDRTPWKVPFQTYQMIQKASEDGGKIILSCRTHFFKDRTEQDLLYESSQSYMDFEDALVGESDENNGDEQKSIDLIYLQELNDDQVAKYFNTMDPKNEKACLNQINQIYNLTELVHCPLLLNIIHKTIQPCSERKSSQAHDIYNNIVRMWLDHLKSKRWLLDNTNKRDIVLRLAWEMWNSKNNEIHYKKLPAFLNPLAQARKWTEKNIRIIMRELMADSFIKRNDHGYFSFLYPSLMEYFLAKRLYVAFKSKKAIGKLLKTNRFNSKIVYFLWLFDKETNCVTPELQAILSKNYKKLISENALQILYWFARHECNMASKITDVIKMQLETAGRIPTNAQLSQANLQEIDLEAANMHQANLQQADLTRANLINTLLQGANIDQAVLTGTVLETEDAEKQFESLPPEEPDTVEDIADSLEIDDDDDDDAIDLSIDEADEADEADEVDDTNNPPDETDGDEPAGDEIVPQVEGPPVPDKPIDPEFQESEEEQPMEYHPKKTDLIPSVQSGHNYTVCSVCYNQKQHIVASSDSGGNIIVCTAKDKHVLFILDGHYLSVNAVDISPDGKYLVSGSDDQTVRIWNLENGESLHILEGHQGAVSDVVFSPDNKTMASCGEDQTIRIWNFQDAHVIQALKGHTSTVLSLAFSPDGKFIASASFDKTVRLWEIRTGELVRTYEGHQRHVTSVAFSPNGMNIASASEDHTLRLWNVQKRDVVRVFHGHSSTVTSVDFSPDGEIIASSSYDHSVRLWNIQNGHPVNIFKGHNDSVYDVIFMANPRYLASASVDQSVCFWDTEQAEPIHVFERYRNHIETATFSPDGEAIANTNKDNSICLWRLVDGDPKLLIGHENRVTSICYSPDSKRLVSGSDDQTVHVWDIQECTPEHVLYGHSDGVTSVDFSSDNNFLASASQDQTVRIWDASKGNCFNVLKGHSKTVNSVRFSPNGSVLASASHDRTIRLWNVQLGRKIRKLKGHSNAVISVDFSPDGHFMASGSYDKTVRIWNVQKGKTLHVLKGHNHSVVCVMFSPDGKFVASASYDQTVRIWNVKTGQCYKILKGHVGGVYSIQYATNGKFLVAAGTGGRLQFWDSFIGKTFLYRYYFAPDAWIDLMPEGRFNGSSEGQKYLRYTEKGVYKSYAAEQLKDDFLIVDDVKTLLQMFNKGRVQPI